MATNGTTTRAAIYTRKSSLDERDGDIDRVDTATQTVSPFGTKTGTPCSFKRVAADSPAMPPPTMSTGAWASLMMRPYSSSTWTMTSVGAALTRLASIGTLFWSSLMPANLASRGRAHR